MLRILTFSAAFTILFVLAVLTSDGQRVDDASLGAFPRLREGLWMEVYGLRDAIVLGLCVVAALTVVCSALHRHFAAAVRAVLVVVLTAGITFGLDVIFVRPALGSDGYAYNTYPSGHVALSVAAVVAVARARSPRLPAWSIVALAVSAFAVAVFSLLSFAHRASDVVGGVLLAGAVSAVIATFSRAATRVLQPEERTRSLAVHVVSGMVLFAACACIAMAVSTPPDAAAALAGAATIAASGALIFEITVHTWGTATSPSTVVP